MGKNGQSVKYVYIPSAEYANSDEKIKDFFTTIILKTDISDDPGCPVNALRIMKNQDSNLNTLLEYFQKEMSAAEEAAGPAHSPSRPAVPPVPAPSQTPVPVSETPAPMPLNSVPERETETKAPKTQEKKSDLGAPAFGKSTDAVWCIGSADGRGP